MDTSRVIGFIGAGKMGSSLALGIVRAGLVPAANVMVYDTYPPILEGVREKGLRVALSNSQVIHESDVIVLAIKPQMIESVKKEFEGKDMSKKVLLSILPGVTIKSLEKFGKGVVPVVRAMPNTPCLVNKSASAFSANAHVSGGDKLFISDMFSAVGICFEVDEDKLEIVTGVSGSGPAYIYMVIESMADAGVKLGLSREVATKLAAQTVVGAGQMVLETGEHPAVLKSDVSSPGGATVCGLSELEKGGVRHTLIRAVEETCAKSRDLAKHAVS